MGIVAAVAAPMGRLRGLQQVYHPSVRCQALPRKKVREIRSEFIMMLALGQGGNS